MTGFCGDRTITRVASFGGSPETGAALYVFAVTSSWEQHAHMTDGRRRGGSGTMHYGSQKIRDPDMRARHVPRRINEGAAAPRFLVLLFSPLRERNLLRKCRRKINRNKSIEGNIKGKQASSPDCDTCVFYVRTCVKRRFRRGEARRGEAIRHIASRRCASMCTRGKTARTAGQGQKLTHPGPTSSVL
ncbi:hypothetical protein G5I_01455 [Acromyrmex echinatior]|uniref:Uncharacterized protein n=1 Tax=Acromyrmex echinatior TaxID=103372 RepID=F4W7N9_ACREC|nr:hypothetical protein G5I_01455 [Acromyrmex echinatior]